jgi:hypothetical protein
MIQGTPQAVLDTVSKSHLDNTDCFRTTIAENKPATIIMVPQSNLRVKLLHHGSLFPRGLGMDPDTVFMTGNYISALLNVVEEVVLATYWNNWVAHFNQD